MTTTSRKTSISEEQKAFYQHIVDNLDKILLYFKITYTKSNKMFRFSCPIHEGDNESAVNIYFKERYGYVGNWKCRTHHCEKQYGKSIIGFVRGLMAKTQPNISMDEASKFIQEILEVDPTKLPVPNNESGEVINEGKADPNEGIKLSKEKINEILLIPAPYFIGRGVPESILTRYDVGVSLTNPNLLDRAIVPIYDIAGETTVGTTARSVFDKCPKCSVFHNPALLDCPLPSERWRYSKWRHSLNFSAETHLYNIWFAKNHIQEKHSAIVVESPGNCWALENAGIHNSVAIFGTSLGKGQLATLIACEAKTLLVALDNDKGGKDAEELILETINQYNSSCLQHHEPTISLIFLDLPKEFNDIAEMTPEQINAWYKNSVLLL